MNFARFFVNRPIFAAVLSIVITMLGALAYVSLPIAQYRLSLSRHRGARMAQRAC